MSNLSDITLVIPSFNRHKFALRNLKYWNGRGAQIILLDGSEKPISESELEELDCNIKYYHIPESYYDRIEKSIEFVKTPYVSFLSDDDFFIPSALQACIDFLNDESDYVSCTGQCIGFSYENNELMATNLNEKMLGYEVAQNHPIERFVYHLETYMAVIYYSVMRTPVWKSAVKLMAEKHYPYFSIGELQLSTLVCFAGKMKVIPVVMWLRSAEAQPIRNGFKYLEPLNGVAAWWFDHGKAEERHQFIDQMVQHLKHFNNFNDAEIFNGVEKAFKAYAEHSLPIEKHRIEKFNKKQSSRKIMFNWFSRLSPSILKKILKPYLANKKNNSLVSESNIKPLISYILQRYKEENYNINTNDLFEIENCLQDFYRKD